MKNISCFDFCYGCGVCDAACSFKAIKMSLDEDGFIRPLVDASKCTECKLCLKVCAYNDSQPINSSEFSHGYAAYVNDDSIRASCSSGGIGYQLAHHALQDGYKACVVKYDSALEKAVHFVATNADELAPSQGSKYLQSHTTPAFSSIEFGNKYIVIGTPCQIDSLRRYIRLKRKDDDFLFVDFFCHGVPSSKLWKKYIREFGIKEADEVKWRDKRTGWHDSWNMVFKSMAGETSSRMSEGDLFYRFYLRNRCLGAACYDSCKYKMTSSAADIRIGDLWGSKYQSDEKGVSGVIAFTQKGDDALRQLRSCTIIEENLDVITEAQMRQCPKRPSSYSYVSNALKTEDSLKRIDKKASRIEFVNDFLPRKIKHFSKRLWKVIQCR